MQSTHSTVTCLYACSGISLSHRLSLLHLHMSHVLHYTIHSWPCYTTLSLHHISPLSITSGRLDRGHVDDVVWMTVEASGWTGTWLLVGHRHRLLHLLDVVVPATGPASVALLLVGAWCNDACSITVHCPTTRSSHLPCALVVVQ